jgi:hypothetical protein
MGKDAARENKLLSVLPIARDSMIHFREGVLFLQT